MQHANKFVLVTERELNELKTDKPKNSATPTSRDTTMTATTATTAAAARGSTSLTGLDAEISQILNDVGISDDVKVKRYSDALTRYRQATDKDYSSRPVASSPHPEDEAMLFLPPIQQYKARRLLRKIKETRLGEWNADGNLVYKQSTVPGSNVTDLLTDLLQTRSGSASSSSETPAGWPQFARLLVDAGVSKELVPNSKRWTYLNNLIKNRTGAEKIDGPRLDVPARRREVEEEEEEEVEEQEEEEAQDSYKTPVGKRRKNDSGSNSGSRSSRKGAKGRKKANRREKKSTSALSPAVAAATDAVARSWIKF